MPIVYVVYATRSGTSEEFAHQLVNKLESAQVQVNLFDIADWFNEDTFSLQQNFDDKLLVLLLSTCENGSAPESATDFYEYVQEAEKEDKLAISFTMLGNGDSRYASTYQLFPRRVKQAMTELSSMEPVVECVERDASSLEDNVFENWAQKIVDHLCAKS